MKSRLLLVLLALACLGGCMSISSDERARTTVRIDGFINASAYQGLRDALMKHGSVSEITLNSRGGEEAAALQIAKLIHEHQISVRIDGFCMSACAHLLLAAAPVISAADGSLIALHTNIFGWLAELNETDNPMYEELLESGAEQYAFLTAAGIDPFVLYCAHVFHEPVAPTSRQAASRVRLTRYSYLVVDEDIMRSVGYHFSSTRAGSRPLAPGSFEGKISERARFGWTPDQCASLPKGRWLLVENDLKAAVTSEDQAVSPRDS
jgi:hypothetical protein